MVLVSVLYPAEPGSRFDRDYYLQRHMPLLKERWAPMGMTEARAFGALAAADGGPATYQVVTLLTFDSAERFQAAVRAHAKEIMGDIPNFTSVQPVVQINQPLA